MRYARLIVIAACLIVLLVAGKFLLTSGSFSLGNPYWDGISSIALRGAEPVYDFGQLRQAGPSGTLLVIGPSAGYTKLDAEAVSCFMLNGGRTIVMDDYGTAGTLLKGIDAPVEIGRVPLCQDNDYYRSPALPLVRDIASHDITQGVDVLAFNHPVPLQLSGDAVPLAGTSPRAWLDYDDNSTLDGNETLGNYTLIARAGYGKGELIVAGDADLLINSMLKKGDNGRLLDNVLGAGKVYVDAGHGQPMPLLAGLFFSIKYNAIAQVVCVIAVLGLAAAGALAVKRRGKKEVTGESPAETKRSLIAAMKARMPLSERDLKILNKKL